MKSMRTSIGRQGTSRDTSPVRNTSNVECAYLQQLVPEGKSCAVLHPRFVGIALQTAAFHQTRFSVIRTPSIPSNAYTCAMLNGHFLRPSGIKADSSVQALGTHQPMSDSRTFRRTPLIARGWSPTLCTLEPSPTPSRGVLLGQSNWKHTFGPILCSALDGHERAHVVFGWHT